MADKNIGVLPQAEDLYDDSLFVTEHSGTAQKVTGRQFKDYAKQGVEAYVESAQSAAKEALDAVAQIGTAVEDTQANKEASQAARTGAEAARTAIENMLVEAVTQATGQPATVTKEMVDGVVKLVFGLPSGPKGDTGEAGPSIQGIVRTAGTGAAGTTDTYTITLTDGSTTTFQVYNGADGIGAGDMLKATYDSQNRGTDIFTYTDQAVENKQDKITGAAGQIVGFDVDGNPVAQEPQVTRAYVDASIQTAILDSWEVSY